MFFKRPRARRSAVLLVSCAFSLLLLGCKDKADKDAAHAQQQTHPPAVNVVKVVRKPVTEGTTFIGRIEAIRSVDLISRINGFLKEQKFRDGQEVKAGDLLFTIEREPYQAAVNAARANLAQAKANAVNARVQAARARALARTRDIPLSTLDDREAAEKQADAQIEQMQAALEQSEINLGYTEIRAPFAGRIGRANFKLGALVGPNTGALATIVSQDPVYATFPVSDRLIQDFRAHQTEGGSLHDAVVVRLFLSNGKEYPYPGKIDFTDVRVNRGTDTLLVRAVVRNPDRLLVDGQYVQVLAEQKEPVEALVVPQRSILTDQSGTFVFVVMPDSKVAQKHVTTGQAVGTDTVVQGVQEGDRIVVDGLQQLRPGAQVDARLASDTSPGQPAESGDERPASTDIDSAPAKKRLSSGI